MNRQTQENLQQFVERYMAVWNEADADRRTKGISEVWTEDGVQFTSKGEYRGHQALQERISTNHETFVKTQGLLFRVANVAVHHDAVKLVWEMLPAQGGEVRGSGVLFLLLSDDGRVRLDYQF
ncbi:MAG: nuclear transport factor 2 family protein [Ktedonobacteraceae bacterium]|nr:nuclear transport factor 2 family protein [Ktedonobacteraceae bacterium]MBO0796087.1 nuclear transport factor 2 family protein [Ktedonobacteraceae bacterium]